MENVKENEYITGLIDDLYNDFLEEISDEEAKDLNIDISNPEYKIINEYQANYFLRKIKELQDQNAHIKEMCDNEIKSFKEKVEDFQERKTRSNTQTIEYFSSILEKYAHSELDDSKKKSLSLPFGTLQFRKSKAALNYDDVDNKTLVEQLKANNLNDLIKVKEDIDKTSINKNFKIQDGKVYIKDVEFPSIKIKPEEIKFSIKTK